MPIQACGYAAKSARASLGPFYFERRDLQDDDVHMKVKFCGVCHSDVHQARDEWSGSIFPMVPGHEIIGVVETVGKAVTKLKKGDIGAVGCFVDSCLACQYCKKDEEQHCDQVVPTYNGLDHEGHPTYGGYSTDIVVKDHFVCCIPKSMEHNLAGATPLLCAGITTWTPMIRHGMNHKGKKIGIIGLGGLGHMALQFAVAFGAEAHVISRSTSKKEDALKLFGAKEFILSTDAKQMDKFKGTLDFIVDTVSGQKSMADYFSLLAKGGLLVTVGLPPASYKTEIKPSLLVSQSKGLHGSVVGGLKPTQEMLDFCGKNNIYCKVEIIKVNQVNEAFERMVKSDVRYRFVIDVEGSLLKRHE